MAITEDELGKKLASLAYDGNCREIRQLQKEFPAIFANAILTEQFQYSFVMKTPKYDREMIVTFVELGVDLNRHDSEGYWNGGTYPLAWCVRKNNPDNVRLLLELGADPILAEALIRVAFMEDGSEAQIAMAKLLLESGADIHQEREGAPEYTAVVFALERGHEELAAFLVSQGAEMPEFEESPELDLDTFQERLEAVCREHWHEVTKKYPDEKFCLFGLETDGEFVILSPLLDSEGAVERDKENRLPSDSFIDRVSIYADAEFYGEGIERFDDLSAELNSNFGADETKREYSKRLKRTLGIFESALKTLDQEGLFGTGPERDRIILLVSILDADEAQWKTMLKTAKRLNPPSVFKQYRSSLRIKD